MLPLQSGTRGFQPLAVPSGPAFFILRIKPCWQHVQWVPAALEPYIIKAASGTVSEAHLVEHRSASHGVDADVGR